MQIYSATAGHSGVRFGPLAADSSLTNFIMNGEFIVSYGAFLDSGSVAVTITNSHPYNCAINVVKGLGSMLGSQFVGNTFDNASGGDLVTLGAASAVTFTGNYFEAVNSGHSALSLVGSNGVALVNNSFLANAGAVSAVVESGGANYTSVSGGVIPVSTNFSSLFNLSGAQSWARGIAGYNPLGLQYAFSGTTVSTQAQNTTVYLGSNGAQASSINTAYVVPSAGTLTTINLAVDTTPAAGQTYTFTAYNGAAIVGSPLVVSNTGFGGLMTLNSSVAVGDQISIKSVFSATSGAANIRYSVSIVG